MASNGVDLQHVVLIVLVLISAVASSAMFLQGSSQKSITVNTSPNPQLNLLSVSADASDDFTPDKADLTFSVVTQGQDPAQMQADNDNAMSKIISDLKATGLVDSQIKTVSYSLNKLTEWDNTLGKNVDKGYQLTNTVKVTEYDVKQAGKILSIAVNDGANDVSDLAYSLSDVSLEKAKTQLLQRATAKAKAKAQSMADSAGVSLKGLSSLSESSTYNPPVDYAMGVASAAPMAARQSVPVSAGTVSITVSVNAAYEIG